MHRRPLMRLLYCVLGAGVGIGFALHLAGPPVSVFFLASLGGSSVFLFGLTRAPAAQPRALFGGHLGGAAIGIACYHILGGLGLCSRTGSRSRRHVAHAHRASACRDQSHSHDLHPCRLVGLDSARLHWSRRARALRRPLEPAFSRARSLSGELV